MKKLLLILVILVAAIVLTGCYVVFTVPDCCQPPCNVTVISISPDVYGEILVNGQRTGKYFLPYQSYQSITIGGIFCNEVAVVSIIDYCGYLSHEEYIYVIPGSNNYVIFDYWGPYGVYKNQQKEQEQKGESDCHCY